MIKLRLLLLAVTFAAISAHAANPWTVSTSSVPGGLTTTTIQSTSSPDASFVIFCTSAGTFGYYLDTPFATGNASVRYRVGPTAVISETWSESPGPGSRRLLPPSVDLAFVRRIFQNWDVVFQYNALVQGSQTAQINASGLSEALDQTRAACHWPIDMLPPGNGWGKPLPTAAPPEAQEAVYIVGAPNEFRLLAWRAHAVDGKVQLLARLGDHGGPCVGALQISDHRLYVTQGDKTVSAVSGQNFSVDCLVTPIIVSLSGDFDASKPFTLNMHSFHASANDRGTPIAAIAFDDQAAAIVSVIEYYNAALDHYFITWAPVEIALLDAGTTIKGWVRTGSTFTAYLAALNGTSPVCRYYIPPGLGDSHFFGRGTGECDETGAKHPTFTLEAADFFRMLLPFIGTCPPNTMPVYRVFSNRADANHRYMTDKLIRTAMVAKGWLAEGDGADLIVMCAPL